MLLTLRPCPPCCFAASSRTLQHGALCAPQHLPGGKTPRHGQEGDKNQRKKPVLSPPLSLPSPRPKTVNTVSPASCVLPVPVPQPSPQSWHGMWCWSEGRRKAPGFPAGTCRHGQDASPKEASVRERAKDETARPKTPLGASLPGAGAQPDPQGPGSSRWSGRMGPLSDGEAKRLVFQGV